MQYASVMSLVASCEPGGRRWISNEMTEKVPQVVANKSESTHELINEFGNLVEGVFGKE